jgi:hypothetical protein
MRLGHRFLPVLLAIGVVSCGDDGPGSSPSAPARGTFLNMTSETGDYIGQGRTRNYTPDTTSFEGAATCDRNQVRIYANSGNGDWWYVTMQAPKGTPLTSGTYNNATRWPFQASVTPGLDVSGEGRGCNRSWGSFIISDASFGPNGKLQRFHATFEQRCEQQSSPGLRGEIRVVDIPVWGSSTCP